MAEEYSDYVPLMKALADETRLKIVDMLSCGELCACDLLRAFDITQPTLSYHMKILTESGLVYGAREGSWTRYRLDKERFEQLSLFLEKLVVDKDDCICRRNSSEKTVCESKTC